MIDESIGRIKENAIVFHTYIVLFELVKFKREGLVTLLFFFTQKYQRKIFKKSRNDFLLN